MKRYWPVILSVVFAAMAMVILFMVPKPARASEGKVTYFIAVAFLNAMKDRPAQVMGWAETEEKCQVAILKLNHTDERIQTPMARQLGAEYVCLKIERSNV